MNALIGALLPLGVAAALSPMPLIALIIALFSKQRAANGFGFLLGSLIATAALTAIATLLALGLPSSPSTATHPVKAVIQLILGSAMVLYAFIIWHRRPRPGEPPKLPGWIAKIEGVNPVSAVIFGMVLSAVNVKNLPLDAAAGTHLAGSSSVEVAVIAGVVFVVLSCGALALVLTAALAFPKRTEAPLTRLRETLIAHNSIILAVVFVLAGTTMIGHAISAL